MPFVRIITPSEFVLFRLYRPPILPRLASDLKSWPSKLDAQWTVSNFHLPIRKNARSFARREILYSHGFFNCLVHFICGHEDGYFSRCKATLIRDH